MAKLYECSPIGRIRHAVEERLKLPPITGRVFREESPMDFWARLERAGLLLEALALYDRLAASKAHRAHMRRETKKQFAERIEREGRRAEAERLHAALLASGLSEREAQEELVSRLQPLDGTESRAGPTPDPWTAGRLFRRKEDQDEVLALAKDVP
jgi:hypothetical protein